MKIYYSKMNATPTSLVIEELDILKKIGTVEMHLGGIYSFKKLLDCDIVVVTAFNGARKGKGVISEIDTALVKNTPAFMFTRDNGKTVPDFLKIKSTKLINVDWTANYGTVQLGNSVIHGRDLKDFLNMKSIRPISKEEYMARRETTNNSKEEDAWTKLLKE